MVSTTPISDDNDRIRERAHRIWLERMANGTPGTPELDWAKAEAEVKAEG
jgi:hypothetical protein